MFKLVSFPLKLAAAAAGVAVLGAAAAGTTSPATATAGPVQCAIAATPAGIMTTLAGTVTTDTAIAGTYTFRVTGGGSNGSTNISQGGPFSAAPGGPVTLGQVMLGSPGATYDVRLDVTFDGATVTCTDTVGRRAI